MILRFFTMLLFGASLSGFCNSLMAQQGAGQKTSAISSAASSSRIKKSEMTEVQDEKEEPIAVIVLNDKTSIPIFDPTKAINSKKNLDSLIGDIIQSNNVTTDPNTLERLKQYYKNKLIYSLISGYVQADYISSHYNWRGPLAEQELAQKRNSMAVNFFEKYWQKELQKAFEEKKQTSELYKKAEEIANKKGFVYDLVVLIVKGKDAARSVIAGLSSVKKEEDFGQIYKKYDQRFLTQDAASASPSGVKAAPQASDYTLYKKTIDSLPGLFQEPLKVKVKSMPIGQFQGAKYALDAPLMLKEDKEPDNQLCLVVVPIQAQKAAPADYLQQAESELIKAKLERIVETSTVSVNLTGAKEPISIQVLKQESEVSPLDLVGSDQKIKEKTVV